MRWMLEAGALDLEDDEYSLAFLRCRSKKGRQDLARHIKEMDYGGAVAVVYICDSAGESWTLPKRVTGKEIPILNVVTSPEIEILLILSDEKVYREWEIRGKQSKKASAFARDIFGRDVKDGEIFRVVFSDFNTFVEACRLYKTHMRQGGGLCLYDLLNAQGQKSNQESL